MKTNPIFEYIKRSDGTSEFEDFFRFFTWKKHCEIVSSAWENEGLTQRQLAEKVEKPQSTIARIENKNMNVTFKTMNHIAKAFDKVIEVKFV